MCTFVGRGILAAWTNNAQCIGVETGDQKTALYVQEVRLDGGHSNLVSRPGILSPITLV